MNCDSIVSKNEKYLIKLRIFISDESKPNWLSASLSGWFFSSAWLRLERLPFHLKNLSTYNQKLAIFFVKNTTYNFNCTKSFDLFSATFIGTDSGHFIVAYQVLSSWMNISDNVRCISEFELKSIYQITYFPLVFCSKIKMSVLRSDWYGKFFAWTHH